MLASRTGHRRRRRRADVAARLGLGVLLALTVASLQPDDPYLAQQWGLERIDVAVAWNDTLGEGVTIAIVDSGVDLEHPDLASRLVRRDDGEVLGLDLVDGDDVPQDENGHGTMVAGIAAAATDNGRGVASVAPAAWLLPVRVLDGEGAGRSSEVEEGIRWAVDNGADIINLSLETVRPLPGTLLPEAPTSAVRYAWDRGVIVVAAAGNSGSAFTDYPTSSPVLLVGATDRADAPAEFSDSGRTDAVSAPGVEIISTWCRAQVDTPCDGSGHTYGIADGTSFAAPHVSGVLALLRGLGVDHDRAVELVRTTARDIDAPGRDQRTGYGLVDAAAAVSAAVGERPEPSPQPTPTASPDVTGAGPATPAPPPVDSEPEPEADASVPAPPAGAPDEDDDGAAVTPTPGPSPQPTATDAPTAATGVERRGRGGPLAAAVVLLLLSVGAHVSAARLLVGGSRR